MLQDSIAGRSVRIGILLLGVAIANAEAQHPDIVVSADGNSDFKTVQDVIDAVTTSESTRTVIFIKPGTYKEKLSLPSEKNNRTLMGESYENTILTCDDYGWNMKDHASTRIRADNFFAEGLTFQNTIDSRSGINGGPAAALRVDSDRAIFYLCRLTGFQVTYYTGGNKQSYHKECVIEGTTDFIYGNGIALFEDCIINTRKNSHVTAHSQKLKDGKPANKFGYVFKNCKLNMYPDEDVTSASLSRPWGNGARVAYLNCFMGPHIRKEGWSIWKGRTKHETAYYAEYRNNGPGYVPEHRSAWTHQLNDEEAAVYAKENSTTAT